MLRNPKAESDQYEVRVKRYKSHILVFLLDKDMNAIGEITARTPARLQESYPGLYQHLSRSLGSDDIYSVEDSYVFPEYRNKGFGLALYLEAVEAIDGWLINDVVGSTSPEAVRVWEKLSNYVDVHEGKTRFGHSIKPLYGIRRSGLEDLPVNED